MKITKSDFLEMSMGRYVLRKHNEVGVNKLDEKELKAYEDAISWAWDYFNRETLPLVRLPLYSTENLMSKL